VVSVLVRITVKPWGDNMDEISVAERHLLEDALLNYVGYLEMRVALPEEVERREWFKGKIERVQALRAKIV
jgi:hypothetical protein